MCLTLGYAARVAVGKHWERRCRLAQAKGWVSLHQPNGSRKGTHHWKTQPAQHSSSMHLRLRVFMRLDAMHGWQLMATTQAAFLHGCVGFPCACPSKLLALMCRCCCRLCVAVACSLTGLCWVTLCFGLLPLLLLSRQPPWSWHRQPGRTRHGSQGEWGGQQSERLLHRCTCNGQSICATCSAY